MKYAIPDGPFRFELSAVIVFYEQETFIKVKPTHIVFLQKFRPPSRLAPFLTRLHSFSLAAISTYRGLTDEVGVVLSYLAF